MTDARQITRAHGVLAGGGVAVLAAVIVLAVGAAPGPLPLPGPFWSSCGHGLLPKASISWAAAACLAVVVAVSVGRGLIAAAGTARAQRRLRAVERRLRRIGGHDVVIIPSRRVFAFAAGLRRPRIHLSSAALTALGARELDAVLAHERHHVRRREPMRIAVRQLVEQTLFFAPGLHRLRGRLDELADLDADRAAVRAAGGDARPLASALLTFDGAARSGAGVSPERVDSLIGGGPPLRVPLPPLAGAALALVGVAVLAAAALLGTANPASSGTVQLCAVSTGMLVAIAAVAVRGAPSGSGSRRRGRRRRAEPAARLPCQSRDSAGASHGLSQRAREDSNL